MSVVLIVVMMPFSIVAQETRNIYLEISLNDSSSVYKLGNFIATSLTTGKTYRFNNTGEYTADNKVKYKVSVPVDEYIISAENDNTLYEYTVDMNEQLGDFTTSVRMFSVDSYDGEKIIYTQYVQYGDSAKIPNVPIKVGSVFDKWVKDDGVTEYDFGVVYSATKIYSVWLEEPQYDGIVNITINNSKPTENINLIASELGEYKLVDVNDPERVYSLTFNEDLTYSTKLPNGKYKILRNDAPLEIHNENIVINNSKDIVTIDFDVIHYIYDSIEIDKAYVEHGAKATKTFLRPTKSGYSFSGWFCEPEQNQLYDFNSIITGNTFVYAGFEEDNEANTETQYHFGFEYRVNSSGNVDGAGSFIAINIDTGDVYTFERNSSFISYTYTMMRTQVPAGKYRMQPVNENVITHTENVYELPSMGGNGLNGAQTLYTLKAYDGLNLLDTQYIYYGLRGNKPQTPVKEGYRFVKWVMEDRVTEYRFGPMKEAVNIYAVWEPLPEYKATVNITINGEVPTVGIDSYEEALGQFHLVNINDSSKVYSLERNSDLSFSTLIENGEYKVLWNYTSLKSHNENIVIRNSDDSVTIDFNTFHYMNEGQEYKLVFVENNTATKPITDKPYKHGYNFVGWYCERELENLFDFNTIITQQTFVYAGFEEIQKPTTELTTQPTTQPEAETTTQPTTEATTQPTTQPEAETTTQPTTESTTEATTEETTQPTTKPTTEATTEEATQPTTEATTEATTEEVTQPTTEATTEEVTQPTTESTTEAPTEPEAETTTEPTTEEPTEQLEEETTKPEKDDDKLPPDDPTEDDEPLKTGDSTNVLMYATLGMIAGGTYLYAYFYFDVGMTEEKKKEIVSRIIKWAKNKNKLTKWFAMMLIAIILAYYHAIGKKIDKRQLEHI